MGLGNEYDSWRLDNGEVDDRCERCEEKCPETFEVKLINCGTRKSFYYCEDCMLKGLEQNEVVEVQ